MLQTTASAETSDVQPSPSAAETSTKKSDDAAAAPKDEATTAPAERNSEKPADEKQSEPTEKAFEQPKNDTQSDDASSAPSPSSAASATTTATDAPSPSPSPSPSVSASARAARAGIAAAADAPCTPRDRSDAITGVSLTDSSDPGDGLQAWETVSLNFTGVMPSGGCAGDTVTITAPPELYAYKGSYPVLAADGTTMGTMVVSGGIATITFNDYVETHTNIRFKGFFSLEVRSTMTPGTDYTLEVKVGTTVYSIPATTDECPGCQTQTTRASKYAVLTAGDPARVSFGLRSAASQTVGETLTFTDVLGSGQQLDCSSVYLVAGTTRDAWGAIQFFDHSVRADSIACDPVAGTLTVSVTSTAVGQYFELGGDAIVTANQKQYSDAGSVTQNGVTSPVQATAVRQNGGVDGDGDTPPTPTPTPTTTEPTPTPTTTEPTPTPTTTEPTPTETPTTPTDTPTETPSSPTETPTTSQPTRTPSPRGTLPQTGTDANPMAIGAGLVCLVMGIGTLLAARRRR